MAENTASAAPLGTRYEVAGGTMLLHRSGAGGPTVVFLAGGGMFGLYYWNVHNLVAEFTTSVVYDRLGTGWSDVVDLPRSGTQITDDLRELLRAAAVPGPYVLVGHSLGAPPRRAPPPGRHRALGHRLAPPGRRGPGDPRRAL